MKELLNNFTSRFTKLVGRAWATVAAITLVLLWLIGLPFIGLSDTYQLIINTLTTIITFIMVFAIQNSQNRDSAAFHIKLDALLKQSKVNEKDLIDLENLPDVDVEKLQKNYQKGKK